MKIQNPQAVHYVEFMPIASSSVRVNSIFLDSADGMLKTKKQDGSLELL